MTSCFRRNKVKRQFNTNRQVSHNLSVYDSISLDDDADDIDFNFFSSSATGSHNGHKVNVAEMRQPLVSSISNPSFTSNGDVKGGKYNKYSKTGPHSGWTMPAFSYKTRFSLEDAVIKLREMDKDDNFTKVTSSYKYHGNVDINKQTDDIDVDAILINGFSSADTLLDKRQNINNIHNGPVEPSLQDHGKVAQSLNATVSESVETETPEKFSNTALSEKNEKFAISKQISEMDSDKVGCQQLYLEVCQEEDEVTHL